MTVEETGETKEQIPNNNRMIKKRWCFDVTENYSVTWKVFIKPGWENTDRRFFFFKLHKVVENYGKNVFLKLECFEMSLKQINVYKS